MSTVNRFSEDKDKSSADDNAVSERKTYLYPQRIYLQCSFSSPLTEEGVRNLALEFRATNHF